MAPPSSSSPTPARAERSRPVARTKAAGVARHLERSVPRRQLPPQFPSLDEPARVAAILFDHFKRVVPTALGTPVMIRQAAQVVTAEDAERLAARHDGQFQRIQSQSDGAATQTKASFRPVSYTHLTLPTS